MQMKTLTTKFHTYNTIATDKQNTFYRQNKELLHQELAKLQETPFEHYPEFQDLDDTEMVISIKYNIQLYYDAYQQQEYMVDKYVQELIYNIRRKYPWIIVLEKRISQSTQPICQIQVYTNSIQTIITNKPFNDVSHIIELIKLFIKTCTITITLNCPNKEIIPLSAEPINIYENCTITLIQKDYLQYYDKSQIPPKLLVKTKNVDSDLIIFNDVPLNQYSIEIQGKYIKSLKQKIKIGNNKITISRNDIAQITGKIEEKNKQIDATLHINKQQIPSFGEYMFWAKIGKEYKFQLTKKDYYPQNDSILVKGTMELNFQMTRIQKTILQITTSNIVDQSLLTDVQIMVDKKVVGKTNVKGMLIIYNLEFKKIKLTAYKKGFLQMPLEYDINADNIGDSIHLQMLPDFMSLLNQFHVLVIQPRLIRNLKYQLTNNCQSIPEKQHKIKDGIIVNYGLHINQTDAFDKVKNNFILNITNEKEILSKFDYKSTMVSIEQRIKTKSSSPNIEMMTDRVLPSQYENAQITIYLTYGSEILCQQSLQQNDLRSKQYAEINLQNRSVQLNGKQYFCLNNQQKNGKRLSQKETDQILKLLTNN